MIDWFRMGGYGFFVWSSYGVLALAIVIEVVALRRQRDSAREHVVETTEEERA
ncbi:MAG: heme exporter protein CcmD [Burkholderiales bacterium]|nr:MAG: heme exporter protein CcmD [Burkholderiales bacterium]